MKMSLQDSKKRFSLEREYNHLRLKGKYYTYSPLGLIKEEGCITIPIEQITEVRNFKYIGDRSRTRMVVAGVILIIFNKFTRSKIFHFIEIPVLNIILKILLGIWVSLFIYHFVNRKSLLEISTRSTRYCLSKSNITLKDLQEIIRR